MCVAWIGGLARSSFIERSTVLVCRFRAASSAPSIPVARVLSYFVASVGTHTVTHTRHEPVGVYTRRVMHAPRWTSTRFASFRRSPPRLGSFRPTTAARASPGLLRSRPDPVPPSRHDSGFGSLRRSAPPLSTSRLAAPTLSASFLPRLGAGDHRGAAIPSASFE